MPSPHELVAYDRTVEEVAEHIGADVVIYQTLEDLIESCRKFNPAVETFDCSVFTGEYITGSVDDRYLEYINKLRNDNAKAKKVHKALEDTEVFDSCNGPMSMCILHDPRTSAELFRWFRLADRFGESFTKSRTDQYAITE